jgi:serine/threonine protein kinase
MNAHINSPESAASFGKASLARSLTLVRDISTWEGSALACTAAAVMASSDDCPAGHGVSASTAREPVDNLGDVAFDPSHLAPASEWLDLSGGGYSEVFKARLLGAVVAVKQATTRKKTSGDALLREIRYLRLAGAHPNIVTMYGAFSERGKLHLVLEFASCLRTGRVARACDPLLVVGGIARALVRLHANGIIHRDLKVCAQPVQRVPGPWKGKRVACASRLRQARNVLVAADNRPMLIDFGLACHTTLDEPEWVSRTVGTKKYRPPEMRDGKPAQPSMDMYCFGLLVEKLLKQRRERSSDDREAPLASERLAERDEPRRDAELRRDAARDEPPRRDDRRDHGRDERRDAGRDAGRDGGGRSDAVRDGGRERDSGRERDAHERRANRLLSELATQCTSRETQDRPSAWAVLMRVQRALGDEPSRVDAPRHNIPLNAASTAQMLQTRAARDSAEEEEARARKRRRGDADGGARHKRKHEESASSRQ